MLELFDTEIEDGSLFEVGCAALNICHSISSAGIWTLGFVCDDFDGQCVRLVGTRDGFALSEEIFLLKLIVGLFMGNGMNSGG